MHRELTVWDNTLFSGRIRLPHAWTKEQIKEHTKATLQVKSASLVHCRDEMTPSQRVRSSLMSASFLLLTLVLMMDAPRR